MESFKYRPSILNIGVLIWIFFCISLLLVDRQNISDESGSGVLEVSKYIGIGMYAIFVRGILANELKCLYKIILKCFCSIRRAASDLFVYFYLTVKAQNI